MPECIQCGSFTKFNKGLCLPCYKDKNKTDIEEEVEVIPGMSDKEYNYRFNMIKGRIAETLIQEMFLSLGYNVFRYGMENTIPGIMELLKGVKSDVANEIRRMPDFVVQNPNNNEVYFVEVKFRASGTLSRKDIAKDYAWVTLTLYLFQKSTSSV